MQSVDISLGVGCSNGVLELRLEVTFKRSPDTVIFSLGRTQISGKLPEVNRIGPGVSSHLDSEKNSQLKNHFDFHQETEAGQGVETCQGLGYVLSERQFAL